MELQKKFVSLSRVKQTENIMSRAVGAKKDSYFSLPR